MAKEAVEPWCSCLPEGPPWDLLVSSIIFSNNYAFGVFLADSFSFCSHFFKSPEINKRCKLIRSHLKYLPASSFFPFLTVFPGKLLRLTFCMNLLVFIREEVAFEELFRPFKVEEIGIPEEFVAFLAFCWRFGVIDL